MIFVYVLGKIEAGTETKVLNSFQNVNQVRKASLTYGTYDLCIEAQFKNMEELDNFTINVLRKVPGIKDTVTLITSKAIFPQPGQAVSFG